MQFGLQQRAVVCGGLKGHEITGLEEGLEQKDVGLKRPVAHQHAVGRCAVVLGEPFTQRRVAAAGAIREDDGRVVCQRLSGATGDEIAVERLWRRGSTGERDEVRHEAAV